MPSNAVEKKEALQHLLKISEGSPPHTQTCSVQQEMYQTHVDARRVSLSGGIINSCLSTKLRPVASLKWAKFSCAIQETLELLCLYMIYHLL